jgi:hypothetical protein
MSKKNVILHYSILVSQYLIKTFLERENENFCSYKVNHK